MGLFEHFKTKKRDLIVVSPVTGRVIPLEEIPDKCFSAGIVGPGCGIWPEEGVVRAPFAGIITHVPDTMHAIGLCSKTGIELIIHVGLDTVDMDGKGFSTKVKEEQSVEQGDVLLSFDRSLIAQAGHDDVTMVIVVNSDEFQAVELQEKGDVSCGKPILKVKK